MSAETQEYADRLETAGVLTPAQADEVAAQPDLDAAIAKGNEFVNPQSVQTTGVPAPLSQAAAGGTMLSPDEVVRRIEAAGTVTLSPTDKSSALAAADGAAAIESLLRSNSVLAANHQVIAGSLKGDSLGVATIAASLTLQTSDTIRNDAPLWNAIQQQLLFQQQTGAVRPGTLSGGGTATGVEPVFYREDVDFMFGGMHPSGIAVYQTMAVNAGLLRSGSFSLGVMNDATEWAFSAFLSRSNDRGYVTPGDRQTMGEQAAKLHGIFLAAQDYVFAAPPLPRYVPPIQRKPTLLDMRETVMALFAEAGATPSATDLSEFAKYLSEQYDTQAQLEAQAGELEYIREQEMRGYSPTTTQEQTVAAAAETGNVVAQIDPEGALRRKFREVFAGQIAHNENAAAIQARQNSILGRLLQQPRGSAPYLGWPG